MSSCLSECVLDLKGTLCVVLMSMVNRFSRARKVASLFHFLSTMSYGTSSAMMLLRSVNASIGCLSFSANSMMMSGKDGQEREKDRNSFFSFFLLLNVVYFS